MNVIDKIRKRIMTKEMLEGKVIKEIQITKKEAEQLGDRVFIDNVKLVVVDKLGDLSQRDCFGYTIRKGHKSCSGLKNLYCQNSFCKFYRNDITKEEIKKDIKLYAEEYKK